MKQVKDDNYISVVLQVTEETATGLLGFLQVLHSFFVENFGLVEYIIVSNGSITSSRVSLQKLIEIDSSLKIHCVDIPYQIPDDQAMLMGLEASIGDFVYEFDELLIDYPVQILWKAFESCRGGNDIVLVRPDKKSSFMERLFYRLVNRNSLKSAFLQSSRFHVLSRRAINRLNIVNEIIHYRKFAYCTVGLNYTYIDYTQIVPVAIKKSGFLRRFDFATDLLLLFTDMGKKVTGVFCVLFGGIAMLALIYTIVIYEIRGAVAGWATTMLLLSFGLMGVFVGFTIVIKYLNLILKILCGDQSTRLIATRQKVLYGSRKNLQ
ncbi:MAG: hypothetical protein NTV32_07580 [Gammaproteobacteria bacterium]|nr:hypothetical protein [Gammaproteobacteria bacterium]